MKRFIVFLTLVCMGAFTSAAIAGDYHTGTTLVCSDCHIMHASKQHPNGDGRLDAVPTPFVNLTPNARLLIGSVGDGSVNATCLNCHDNSPNGPDVFGQNTGMYTGVTRMAGALNGTVGSHTLGTPDYGAYSDNTGHTLGSKAVPPGGTWTGNATDGLQCTNCHSAHGAARYRNLTSRPGTVVSPDARYVFYEVGANASTPQTVDVLERSSAQTAAHYRYDNIDYEEPKADSSHYAGWCKGCHTNFHGQAGGPEIGGDATGTNPWVRHPTTTINMSVSYMNRWRAATNKLKVMDSQGLWTGAGADSTNPTLTPSCMTCHKAHGNGNPFGLVYVIGTGTMTDEGDGGQYRDTCRQCHSQGS